MLINQPIYKKKPAATLLESDHYASPRRFGTTTRPRSLLQTPHDKRVSLFDKNNLRSKWVSEHSSF